MKQLVCLPILCVFFQLQIFSQVEKSPSKMDQFVSQTGVMLKFEDYYLPKLKLNYGVADMSIRKVKRGQESKYFCQISSKGKYKANKASIAYEDLLEVMKAIDSMERESIIDLNRNPEYLENRFITDDGFKVVYFISEGKVKWCIMLDKYGSDNTLFLKDIDSFKNALSKAKNKIESIKG